MASYTGTQIMSPHQFGGVSAALNSSLADQGPQTTAASARSAVQTIATTTADQAARKTSTGY